MKARTIWWAKTSDQGNNLSNERHTFLIAAPNAAAVEKIALKLHREKTMSENGSRPYIASIELVGDLHHG